RRPVGQRQASPQRSLALAVLARALLLLGHRAVDGMKRGNRVGRWSMSSMKKISLAVMGCALGLFSRAAVAQTVPDPDPQHRTQIGEGVPRDSTALPPPRSDH